MKTQKPHKQALENLATLERMGGVCPSSEWVNGRGRYTTRKALPPFAEVITVIPTVIGGPAWAGAELRGAVQRNLVCLLKSRPQLKKVVVISDLRSARLLLKKYGVK